MLIETTDLPTVLLLIPRRFEDTRGWFCESWNAQRASAAGLECNFVQDNHSYSHHCGTLRGLHYQSPPHAQDKLIRCTKGAIFDVVIDARQGSLSYGKWITRILTADIGEQLFVPKGFLHGFLTLTSGAEVQYKCSDVYHPDSEGSVLWSSLEIDWPLNGVAPVLSAKDLSAPAFADWTSPFKV